MIPHLRLVIIIFFGLILNSCKDMNKNNSSVQDIVDAPDTLKWPQKNTSMDTFYVKDNPLNEQDYVNNNVKSNRTGKASFSDKPLFESKSVNPSEEISDKTEGQSSERESLGNDNKIPVVKVDTAVLDRDKPVQFKKAPDHKEFNVLLQKYVTDNGLVDYAGMTRDKQLLSKYIKSLEGPFEMDSWTTNQKLAYWINVYNAYTIQLILDNYPVSSIRQLYNGKPWSEPFVLANNTYYTLDELEKKVIIKRFGDSRVHFALNCAAKSCPPLWNAAYTGENVEILLDRRTRDFINSRHNQIDKTKTVLSPLFQWYSEDFGDLIDFINQYSPVTVTHDTKISFSQYDWSLNKK